jgi:hypothetical protein
MALKGEDNDDGSGFEACSSDSRVLNLCPPWIGRLIVSRRATRVANRGFGVIRAEHGRRRCRVRILRYLLDR